MLCKGGEEYDWINGIVLFVCLRGGKKLYCLLGLVFRVYYLLNFIDECID